MKRASDRGHRGPLARHNVRHGADEEENDEHEEQDPCDVRGEIGQASKPEHRRNERNDQKRQSPTKHGMFLVKGGVHGR